MSMNNGRIKKKEALHATKKTMRVSGVTDRRDAGGRKNHKPRVDARTTEGVYEAEAGGREDH